MQKHIYSFPNGHTAWVVRAPHDAGYAALLQVLGLPPPQALLLLLGGAGNMTRPLQEALFPLLRDGIAPTAAEVGAWIMDGGTRAGVMAMIGRAVAEQKHRPPLVGIVPEGRVAYPHAPAGRTRGEKARLEPHHSHFVLVEGSEWGDETTTMYGLAKELAQHVPVVTVLINGGSLAKQEVLQSVQLGWPLVIITGSGRLADEIAAGWREQRLGSSAPRRAVHRADTPGLAGADQDLTEIINAGEIHLFAHEGAAANLRALLKQLVLPQEKRSLASGHSN
jgi:hypothetical protein